MLDIISMTIWIIFMMLFGIITILIIIGGNMSMIFENVPKIFKHKP